MTCIAALQDPQTKTVYLAGERAVTSGALQKLQKGPKLHQIRDVWIGCAGSSRAEHLILSCLRKVLKKKGRSSKHKIITHLSDMLHDVITGGTDMDTKDFEALIVAGGEVLMLDVGSGITIEDGPWAVGSGAFYALGALYAAPRQSYRQAVYTAVAAACEYDPNSGGEIDVVEIASQPDP